MQNKTAIILGATGLTGSLLMNQLLEDARYQKIKIFTRRELKASHPKITEIVCDLLELEKYADHFWADEVFCCIGTTTRKTPDRAMYKNIDLGIPVQAAKLCLRNGIPTFVVISSLGANANSSIFYSKTKGEMEKSVLAEKIKHTYILRPSVIIGKRVEARLGEKIGIILGRMLTPFLIGSLRKYRPISAKAIAKTMIRVANNGYKKSIISSDVIKLWGAAN